MKGLRLNTKLVGLAIKVERFAFMLCFQHEKIITGIYASEELRRSGYTYVCGFLKGDLSI